MFASHIRPVFIHCSRSPSVPWFALLLMWKWHQTRVLSELEYQNPACETLSLKIKSLTLQLLTLREPATTCDPTMTQFSPAYKSKKLGHHWITVIFISTLARKSDLMVRPASNLSQGFQLTEQNDSQRQQKWTTGDCFQLMTTRLLWVFAFVN